MDPGRGRQERAQKQRRSRKQRQGEALDLDLEPETEQPKNPPPNKIKKQITEANKTYSGITIELKIVSLNIRGLTGKESFLVNLAAKLRVDFMFLQESYIDSERKFVKLLEKLGITKGSYSAGTSKTNGVCTLQFSDRHEITDTNQDNEGRYTITRIKSRDRAQETTLVNTYAPCNKQEQREFVKNIHYKLEHFHKDERMIWGGDFNVDYRENSIETRSLLETIQCFKLQSH